MYYYYYHYSLCSIRGRRGGFSVSFVFGGLIKDYVFCFVKRGFFFGCAGGKGGVSLFVKLPFLVGVDGG